MEGSTWDCVNVKNVYVWVKNLYIWEIHYSNSHITNENSISDSLIKYRESCQSLLSCQLNELMNVYTDIPENVFGNLLYMLLFDDFIFIEVRELQTIYNSTPAIWRYCDDRFLAHTHLVCTVPLSVLNNRQFSSFAVSTVYSCLAFVLTSLIIRTKPESACSMLL